VRGFCQLRRRRRRRRTAGTNGERPSACWRSAATTLNCSGTKVSDTAGTDTSWKAVGRATASPSSNSTSTTVHVFSESSRLRHLQAQAVAKLLFVSRSRCGTLRSWRSTSSSWSGEPPAEATTSVRHFPFFAFAHFLFPLLSRIRCCSTSFRHPRLPRPRRRRRLRWLGRHRPRRRRSRHEPSHSLRQRAVLDTLEPPPPLLEAREPHHFVFDGDLADFALDNFRSRRPFAHY